MKEKSAKSYSLASMIIAGCWIGILTLLKGFRICNFSLEINDIVFTGIALAGVFSPIYFSIFLDKIKAIKFGDRKNEEEYR